MLDLKGKYQKELMMYRKCISWLCSLKEFRNKDTLVVPKLISKYHSQEKKLAVSLRKEPNSQFATGKVYDKPLIQQKTTNKLKGTLADQIWNHYSNLNGMFKKNR